MPDIKELLELYSGGEVTLISVEPMDAGVDFYGATDKRRKNGIRQEYETSL